MEAAGTAYRRWCLESKREGHNGAVLNGRVYSYRSGEEGTDEQCTTRRAACVDVIKGLR